MKRTELFKGKIKYRVVTENAGVLESNEQECDIKRRMIENSKTKYYNRLAMLK